MPFLCLDGRGKRPRRKAGGLSPAPGAGLREHEHARRIAHGDVLAVDRQEACIHELVQHAREGLGGEAEARGDEVLVDGQRHGEVLGLRVVGEFEQVACHALERVLDGIAFHVLHEGVQPQRQPREQMPCKGRVLLDGVGDDFLAHVQHHAVFEQLRAQGVGAAQEHDGFAEALARMDDLDDFLAALRGGDKELAAPEHHHVHAVAGVAATEQVGALLGTDFAHAQHEARDLGIVELLEQGLMTDELTDIYFFSHDLHTGKRGHTPQGVAPEPASPLPWPAQGQWLVPSERVTLLNTLYLPMGLDMGRLLTSRKVRASTTTSSPGFSMMLTRA